MQVVAVLAEESTIHKDEEQRLQSLSTREKFSNAQILIEISLHVALSSKVFIFT